MKGKLHKMVSGYILSLNGDIDDPYGIVNEELAKDHEWYRLSLKNCQAVERGYDLDELAMGYDLYENINFVGQMRAFKVGFQKALELMGDKKFSEEDVREAFFHVQNEPTFDVFIQSLQQTEWDVEVETVPALSNNGNVYYGDIPKLDATGCLILKRI
jgi:hypothetical protein